jgi:hypothetical protein
MIEPTGSSQDGAGNSHAFRQDNLGDGVDFDSAEEDVGQGFVQLNVHGASQWVVDTFDGDLVLSVLNSHLVVGHVRSQPVADKVRGLDSDVADNSGHLLYNKNSY